ncbi:MarR family winged helix-turn-helix transcriptional regulator [Arthrobacter globiformis]|uniref:MarR family winged helix-turn-helix transcriptional regulator n=1 Tax=Arthrobacter globiformis TaxID=1665 RepID=UPI00278E93C7|nr:MarR family transcriptional regulator [Arthrobacter globiformis]MDQ0616710.1 DNA-binding MarR family transcriptional regulator [Arthrobacter globiformis]
MLRTPNQNAEDEEPASPPAEQLTVWPKALRLAKELRPPLTMLGIFLRETNPGERLTTSQCLVLSQLSGADSLPMSELAAADNKVLSTMTELVGRLVAAGYVTKDNGVEDRRQVRVSITDSGRTALAATLLLRTELLASRIDGLTGTEQSALEAALPALWKLAAIDPTIWPRVVRQPLPRRRTGKTLRANEPSGSEVAPSAGRKESRKIQTQAVRGRESR